MGLITGLLTLPIAPVRGPRSDRCGGSSATLPSANCTTQECSVPSWLH